MKKRELLKLLHDKREYYILLFADLKKRTKTKQKKKIEIINLCLKTIDWKDKILNNVEKKKYNNKRTKYN